MFSIKKSIENFLFSIRSMSKRQILMQFLYGAYSVFGSYFTWKMFGLLLNNDAPIVVVLTESMEPGFVRGDILFLGMKPYSVGDMTVFQFFKDEIPIVHRAIKKYGDEILTKGDNNYGDDVPLYRFGLRMLPPKYVNTQVVGYIPFFGMITIWINTYPALKFILMGFFALTAFLTRVS